MNQVNSLGNQQAQALMRLSEGTWDVEFEKYLAGSANAPAMSVGMDENVLYQGELWLTMNQHYEYPGGVFQGRSMYGYDPVLQKYVGLWVDSTNSHLNVSEGSYDEKSRTLTLTADGVDPTKGERTRVTQVKEFRDDDTLSFSVYRGDGVGKDILLLQVTAHRRKDEKGSYARKPFLLSEAQSGFHHDWPSSYPTVFHNLLRREEGVWEAKLTIHQYGQKKASTVIAGTETNTLIGNGLWLTRDIRSETPQGLFQARELLGYDSEIGRYVGAWVDSTNPHRSVWEGRFDEASQTLTLVAKAISPYTKEQVQVRKEVVYRDNEVKEITIYHTTPEGNTWKAMESTVRRIR
jgi:hypothetical protein